MKGSCLLRPVWMILFFCLAVEPDSALNRTLTAHTVHLGNTTTINCDYNKTCERETLRAVLSRGTMVCSYLYQHKSWRNQSCKNNIRLIWDPKSEEIFFELLNLQISDLDVYECVVEKQIPPPTKTLGVQRTPVEVIARPVVSVSCVRGSYGFLAIFCTLKGFYPSAVEQAWIRDGDLITYLNTSHTFIHPQYMNNSAVHWNSSINTDRTHNLLSYLHLQTHTDDQMYSCWVNHSSLNQPITVNMSSFECSEKEKTDMFLIITCTSSAVLTAIILFMTIHCLCLNYLQPPADGIKTSELSQVEYHISASPRIISASPHSSLIMYSSNTN